MNHVNAVEFQFKPYKLVPYQEKPSLVGKHVRWLKQERHEIIERIAIVALIALEVLALACTVVGLVTIYKGIQEAKRIDAEKAFFKDAAQKHPPALEEQIKMKSKTRTFNHTHEFAIENGVIWSRPQKSQEAWKPVYFDGHSTGKIPVEISCDGANLVILDQYRNVHYKKVLREYRSNEIKHSYIAQQKIKGSTYHLEKDQYVALDLVKHHYEIIDLKQKKYIVVGANQYERTIKDTEQNKLYTIDLKQRKYVVSHTSQGVPVIINLEEDKYIAIDKSERNNWKDKWFSLPYFQAPVNLFMSKILKLPANIRAWAISHRGVYNDYLEDAKLRRHPETSVTTLYTLLENGKEIWMYDPWSPKFAKISIMLPETSNTSFEALNMSVGASTIMVIGYESEKIEQGVKKTLKIKTKLADIDSEGWNPAFKRYGYFLDPNDRNVYVIPLPQWEDHSLELKEGASITDKITIVQTGAGNDARELFVEGTDVDENGTIIKGYYYKTLKSATWQFKPYANQNSVELGRSLELKVNYSESFQTTVYDYQSHEIDLKSRLTEAISAQLKNFGLRSYDSELELQIGDEVFALQIHKRKTLKNFLGLDGESYELVIPEIYHNHSLMKKIFNDQKVIPLDIQEKDQTLTIAPYFSPQFKFNFQKI